MLQIRASVFETNSSTTHAFWVRKPDKVKPFSEKTVLTAKFTTIHWEFDKYEAGEFLDIIWTWMIEAGLFAHMGLLNQIVDILKQYNIHVNWTVDLMSEEKARAVKESTIGMAHFYLTDLVLEPEVLVALILNDSTAVIHATDEDMFKIEDSLESTHVKFGDYSL
ncbi:MAG: hypothetical protein LBP87_00855 [Planctomycetaceae bacterium]|jgi:hypothetical protein|nr:hypothetical protein [Planctomycetaceae bacterium]